MKSVNVYFMSLLIGSMALSSCGKNEVVENENEVPEGIDNIVSFQAQLNAPSRATDTKFDANDQIGVFAVASSGSNDKGIIADRGNYADNVKYTYDGTKFTSANGIEIEEDGQEYFYHAVYPYTSAASSAFNFRVQDDQRGDNYTLSDLCTAHTGATSSTLVQLNFSHRLSKVIVNLTGNNWPSGDRLLTIKNAKVSATANLNNLTFTSTSVSGDVICTDNGTNSFKVILPPQTILKDDLFATLQIGNTEYSVSLSNNLELRSGVQAEIALSYNDDKAIVEFVGDINPWDEVDNRFNDVVPADIREKLEKYITIYNGVNPPNVEGVYLVDPFVTVYCEDEGTGGYEPGDLVASNYIKLSNQNFTNNTLDYENMSVSGNSHSTGEGAFISGSGNNFTAFFNTIGESSDIYTKTALVISGTKSASGIQNLQYAFIMVEKGYDPNEVLMKEGVFRVFKDQDGLSINTSWPSRSISIPSKAIYDIFSTKK
jgi:hypothetical protein